MHYDKLTLKNMYYAEPMVETKKTCFTLNQWKKTMYYAEPLVENMYYAEPM